MNVITSSKSSVKRYRVLRIVGVVFTQLGVLALAIGTLFLVIGITTLVKGPMSLTLQGGGPFPPAPIVVPLGLGLGGTITALWSLVFFTSALQSLAMGGLIRVLIDLEANTRASAESLDKIRLRGGPVPERIDPIFES